MLVSQLDHVSLQVPRPQMLGPAQSIERLGCKGHRGTWSRGVPLKHRRKPVRLTWKFLKLTPARRWISRPRLHQITQTACLWLKQGSCERGSVIETLEIVGVVFLCHATGSNSAAQIQMRKSIWIWCCCCCFSCQMQYQATFPPLMLTRPKIPKSTTIFCKP